MSNEFIRYLAAKRTVDDRALNRLVWDTLKEALPAGRTLDVLEIGAGIGTMAERCLEWGLLERAHYTALDADSQNTAAGRHRLEQWAQTHGWSAADLRPDLLRLAQGRRWVDLEFVTGDALAFARRPDLGRGFDLLIAHAFLDLVDIAAALPQLLGLVKLGGLFYFTITFDGVTSFQPETDPEFDVLVEELYHETMDRRVVDGRPSGDRHAGRHLLSRIATSGAAVLAAGSSDWVVFPRQGRYPGDEAYFLHFIVDTVAGALASHDALDGDRLADWAAVRHGQIDNGELVYIAHQLDVLGRLDQGVLRDRPSSAR